jgi:DNA-binding XRE family transcriptional regulator
LAGLESSYLENRNDEERHSLSVDVSAVNGRGVQTSVLGLMRNLGYDCAQLDRFWQVFTEESPGRLPASSLVVGDLSTIGGRYMRMGSHKWAASVRRTRPYFIGLVHTQTDEAHLSLADELVRNSEMRATVCHNLRADFRGCLRKAASALEPYSLADVRYSPMTHLLWVQFSDGLFGSLLWNRLGLQNEARTLVPQTATVGAGGKAIEILRRDGRVFHLGAGLIRKTLSTGCRPGVTLTPMGDRVRAARDRAGISQAELAARTGMHQTRISRLERGHHCPRLSTLERVGAALGCTVTELLNEE